MVCDGAFISHSFAPCGKMFSLIPRPRSSIKVTIFKTMTVIEPLVFHKHSLIDLIITERLLKYFHCSIFISIPFIIYEFIIA